MKKVIILVNGREREAYMENPVLGLNEARAYNEKGHGLAYNNNGWEFFTETLSTGEFALMQTTVVSIK